LVLVAPACGGDDDAETSSATATTVEVSADDKAYEDAFVFSLAASDFAFNEEQARCAARTTIDAIGIPRLEEAGVNAEFFTAASSPATALTDEEARTLVDALFDCGDVAQSFADDVASDDDELFTPESEACFTEALVDDASFREMLAGVFQEGGGSDFEMSGPLAASLTDIMMGCVDFGELLVAEIEQGGAAFTAGQRDCLVQGFNNNRDLRQVMVAAMTAGEGTPVNDDEMTKVFRAVAITCGIPLNP
jgi:hypothetical protein